MHATYIGYCEAQPPAIVCITSGHRILLKMDEMAAGFEQRIQQWKEFLVKELLRKCMHKILMMYVLLQMLISLKYRW